MQFGKIESGYPPRIVSRVKLASFRSLDYHPRSPQVHKSQIQMIYKAHGPSPTNRSKSDNLHIKTRNSISGLDS